MTKEHVALIVPGLGNTNPYLEWWTKRLQRPHVQVEIYNPQWHEGEHDAAEKLNRLLERVKELAKQGYAVSLIGSSAGGSLALTAFQQMQTEISAAITICACLRIPETPTKILSKNLADFPAHNKFVTIFERDIEPQLSDIEKKRILTMQPLWDNVVPIETMTIPGVRNKRIPMIGHVPSIAASLTVYSRFITNFIQQT